MKPILSIGITAYNEEANIGHLICALIAQKIESASLIEIIVVSDASTDATDEIVQDVSDNRIRLVRHDLRMGGTAAQNTIAKNAKGDILVVLDADIIPVSDKFIDLLIVPIVADPNVGLVSAWLIPAKPVTYVEKILARNHEFKRDLYMSIGDGKNIYTCFGPARALSSNFFKKIQYPENPPVDAYSYMASINEGMDFVFSRSAKVFFRCPSNLLDHNRQTARFDTGREGVIAQFGERARLAYRIPIFLLLRKSSKELFFHPILFTCYILISIYVRINRQPVVLGSRWDMAISSKKI